MKKSILLSMLACSALCLGTVAAAGGSCQDQANAILAGGSYAANYSGGGAIISSEWGGMIATGCDSGATNSRWCRFQGSISSRGCSENDAEIVLTWYDLVGQSATMHLPKGKTAPSTIKASIGGQYASFSADFRRI